MSEKANTKNSGKLSKGNRAKRVILTLAILAALSLGIRMTIQVFAAEPAGPAFERTWQRIDQPVETGQVSRTWMWGPDAFTTAMTEPYSESPGGERVVQYFDKSRMEDNTYRAAVPWDVTNGLLVVELITGNMQVGDSDFIQYSPAEVNVAGDPDDVTGVQYSTLASLLNAPPLANGAAITQRVNQAGNVFDDPSLAGFGVTTASRVMVPGIDHQVASPFWTFMNSNGTVYENGSYTTAPMFLNPFYATGYPITEAYWANVKVAGMYQDVLLQCFERRCLTYTPGNPGGWQVEAGNVGQHYYTWRYGQIPDDEPSPTEPPVTGTPPAQTPSPTPSATPSPDPSASPTPTEEPYIYDWQFGAPVNQDATLDSPHGIAISADGYVYITDWQANRILKYAADGSFVKLWGAQGTGNGEFSNPTGIAVDAAGNIYVSDYNNNRVQKFNSDGEYLTQWGTDEGDRGSGPGDFDGPRGIAIDSSGYVYIVDRNNSRVQKFDSDGVYEGEWGADGFGAGEFSLPSGIAIDDSDTIYVTDYLRCRVQAFDTDGVYLGELDTDTTGGTCSFQFDTGIAVTADGTLYVVDSGKDRVQVFDATGNLLAQLGISGAGPGEFNQPMDVAIDASGDLYITDFDNGRVQKIDAGGNYLDEWTDGRRGWIADSTLGMTMDADGNIYLADDVYDRIQVFESDGEFRREFGEPGSGVGQLDGAVNLAATRDGYIYVVDSRNDRLLKYQRNGVFVMEFGNAYVNVPVGIAVDQNGYIYVANAGNDTIQIFDPSGSFLHVWGESGDGDSQFNYPADIAIHNNRLYVVDHNNHRVQAFDLNGVYLGQFGELGDGNGQFAEPMGIGVDRDGYVYVVDTGNHRVQKFTPTGDYLTQFGTEGSGDGQLVYPSRVEIAANGYVYVLDTNNHRVQVFQPA